MNALKDNTFTRAWSSLGKSMIRPRAILAISAHWHVPGTAVTANLHPPTIHDFGGFPDALFQVQYPAPGSLAIAQRVRDLLSPTPIALNESWGLDHGTWSVLCHAYPDADIPVLQLSMDATQPAQFHYDLGKRLGRLREEGILLVASGNIVHNLRAYAWGKENVAPYDWAVQFESQVRQLILSGEHQALIDYEHLDSSVRLAVPTAEHYLPLLYILGAQHPDDSISFPVEGFEGGSISMLSVMLG